MNKYSDVVMRPVNLVSLKMVREKRLGYESSITRSEDVVSLVNRMLNNSYREIVLVIGMDNRNYPTMVHTVAVGSPNQAPVTVSSVFKPLLLSNAVGFILVHNHPGGAMRPSNADREITERLKKIGEQLEIKMIDHLIIDSSSGNGCYSFKNEGDL